MYAVHPAELDQMSMDLWLHVFSNHAFYQLDVGSPFMRILQMALILEPSSAAAERSFSIMLHIKQPRRSRMTIETVDNIMVIKAHVPPHRYECVVPALQWYLKGGRLPNL